MFAGVGFVEYSRKSLFLNPKVVAANQYDNYFRVNSVFFDPNIYGRFLALVMIAVTTVVLWGRGGATSSSARRCSRGCWRAWSRASRSRASPRCCSGWRCSARLPLGRCARTLYASAGVVALGRRGVLLAPASLHFGLKGSGGSASNATSGRAKLVEGGLELFAERPLRATARARSKASTSATPSAPRAPERDLGVAHDPGDGRGRAGDRSAWPSTSALLVAALLVLFRGAGPLAAADRARGVLRRAGAAHLDLRGLPRGSVHLGAARDRPGARARGSPARALPRRRGARAARARRVAGQ